MLKGNKRVIYHKSCLLLVIIIIIIINMSQKEKDRSKKKISGTFFWRPFLAIFILSNIYFSHTHEINVKRLMKMTLSPYILISFLHSSFFSLLFPILLRASTQLK